jgi:hypothetical protein
MTRRLTVLAALVLLGLPAAALLGRGGVPERFPHDRHARLFPLCIGCHGGIPVGDSLESYPDPAACVNCHDGTRAVLVDWTGPLPRSTNLDFDHVEHAGEIAGEGRVLECATCHTREGAGRMEVERSLPERCFACHAHEARDHFVDARCAVCHVPLAETGFGLVRLQALPVPVTHDVPGFVEGGHGQLARASVESCTTCHVRQQCAGCHVDAARETRIAAIPDAPETMPVRTILAAYPLPPSHLDRAWLETHGERASAATCGTCHTRESCATCHDADAPGRLASRLLDLPSRAGSLAPGVSTTRRPPPSHASPFFATQHSAVAASRPESCATCHSPRRFCQACHLPQVASSNAEPPFLSRGGGASAGSAALRALAALAVAEPVPAAVDTPPPATPAPGGARRPRAPTSFHPSNYAYRHSAEAYNRRLDCGSCHNNRLFCRDCHEQAGFGSEGRLNRGFHDAEPVWLLRHGQAARQTLESCASCHAQRDCMQCHSQVGSFRINPHGAGFDARRAQRRNPRICFACHLTDPLGRSGP